MCQTQFAPPPVLPAYANWKTVTTPLSSLSNEQLKGITITPDTIQNLISFLKEIKARWVVEMIPQIIRAQNRPDGNGKAILVLGMCRKGDCLHGNFEQPGSQVEKILSALEVPGGPSVVLFDLRQDCIRYQVKRDGPTKEHCLPFTKKEVARCLELVIQEINMATNIFGLKFESVFSFSDA
jgi:hypothetical protein